MTDKDNNQENLNNQSEKVIIDEQLIFIDSDGDSRNKESLDQEPQSSQDQGPTIVIGPDEKPRKSEIVLEVGPDYIKEIELEPSQVEIEIDESNAYKGKNDGLSSCSCMPGSTAEQHEHQAKQNLNLSDYFGDFVDIYSFSDTPPQPQVFADFNEKRLLNALTADLSRKLLKDYPHKNYVLSPFSAWSAFALYGQGLSSEGQKELESYIFDGQMNFKKAAELARKCLNLLNGDNANFAANSILEINNLFLFDQNLQLEEEFKKMAQEQFASEIFGCDFRNAASKIEKAINAYVNDCSAGMLPQLLSPGDLSQLSVLLLLNTIYFKGFWYKDFDEELTLPQEFKGLNGRRKVPMMHLAERLAYFEDEKAQYLKLYYEDNAAFEIFLPKDEKADISGLASDYFKQSVDYQNLEIKLTMPRFSLESEFDFLSVLKDAGLDRAVKGDSLKGFFSSLPPEYEKSLYLSAIKQKAKLKVDEQGSEASAATFITAALTSAPVTNRQEVIEMIVDHPFLFKLSLEGICLFCGQVGEAPDEI